MNPIESLWHRANNPQNLDGFRPFSNQFDQPIRNAIERTLWEAQKDWERDRWEFVEQLSTIQPGDQILVDYGDDSRTTFTVRLFDQKNFKIEDMSGRVHDLKRPRTGLLALIFRMPQELPQNEGSVIRVFSLTDFPRLNGMTAVRSAQRWVLPQLSGHHYPDSDILIWTPFK